MQDTVTALIRCQEVQEVKIIFICNISRKLPPAVSDSPEAMCVVVASNKKHKVIDDGNALVGQARSAACRLKGLPALGLWIQEFGFIIQVIVFS